MADVELLASVGVPENPLLGNYAASQTEPLAAIHGSSLFRLTGAEDNTVVWLDVDAGEVVARQGDYLDPNRTTPESLVNSTLAAFLACSARFERAAANAQVVVLQRGYEAAIALAGPLRDDLARLDPAALEDENGFWAVTLEQWANGQ